MQIQSAHTLSFKGEEKSTLTCLFMFNPDWRVYLEFIMFMFSPDYRVYLEFIMFMFSPDWRVYLEFIMFMFSPDYRVYLGLLSAVLIRMNVVLIIQETQQPPVLSKQPDKLKIHVYVDQRWALCSLTNNIFLQERTLPIRKSLNLNEGFINFITQLCRVSQKTWEFSVEFDIVFKL